LPYSDADAAVLLHCMLIMQLSVCYVGARDFVEM